MVRGASAAALAAAMVWQMAEPGAAERPGDARSLRYERDIVLVPGHAGPVCAVLDANTLEHMASRSGDDLRVFAESAGAAAKAVPFTLTESEVSPEEDALATVEHAAETDGAVVFYLRMPPRTYSDVVLQISAEDFVGVATVSATNPAGKDVYLGRFPVFDLRLDSLVQKLDLPLTESRYPELQIRLRLWHPDGRPMRAKSAMVRGAVVPPSRMAQTLYSPVTAMQTLQHIGGETQAEFPVPAHVPVGRVRFEIAETGGEFARRVVIRATSRDGTKEEVEGRIWRVQRRGNGEMPAIAQQSLNVEAVLASNLRDAAQVTVSVEDAGRTPLPAGSAMLEMRQRRVCFDATAGERYELRYGDGGLSAVASLPQTTAASTDLATVELGPERLNPNYRPREKKDEARPTEQLWLFLLASVAVVGLGLRRMMGRLR